MSTDRNKIPVPPEPPVGTWVMDWNGSTSKRHPQGGWAPPGCAPLGRWEAMWLARGPLVECSPWGLQEKAAVMKFSLPVLRPMVDRTAETLRGAIRLVEDVTFSTQEQDLADYLAHTLSRAGLLRDDL